MPIVIFLVWLNSSCPESIRTLKTQVLQCPNIHFDGATVASGRSAYFFRTLSILSYLLNRWNKCSTFWIYELCAFSSLLLVVFFFFFLYILSVLLLLFNCFLPFGWTHVQYNHPVVFHFLLIQSIHVHFKNSYETHLH